MPAGGLREISVRAARAPSTGWVRASPTPILNSNGRPRSTDESNLRINVQTRCGVLCEFTLAFFGDVLLAVASERARVVHAESLPSLWESLPIS